MNRQFQAKISIGSYVLLAALLSVAVYFMWQTSELVRTMSGIVLAIALLMMVVVIERMIHTTYTITADKRLVIHKGRFCKDMVIPLDAIDRIDRINRLRIAGKPLRTSLVIVTKDQTEHHINPTNEEDFIVCITRRKRDKQQDGEED